MESVSAALMCAAQLSIELCTRLHVQLNISLSKILRMMGAMKCYRYTQCHCFNVRTAEH